MEKTIRKKKIKSICISLSLLTVFIILFSNCTELSKLEVGYTDRTTYWHGDTMKLFINVKKQETLYLTITDINGKEIDNFTVDAFPQKDRGDSLSEKGFAYQCTGTYEIPDIPSGIYFINKKIGFIIGSKAKADITFIYPINTINAYCNSGGKSLYNYNSADGKKTFKVSYLRPIPFESYALSFEFLQWLKNLEKQYTINYISDRELDDYANIAESRLLIIAGHNEYWTRKARENFDRFIDEGKDACIFSGNTMWWQVRYECDAMVCYKDANDDPVPFLKDKTIIWSDSSLQYPIYQSIGVSFDYGGFGDDKEYAGFNGYKILIDNSPLFNGTKLKKGDVIYNPTHEYDAIPNLSFNQQGEILLDSSKVLFHRLEILAFDLAQRYGQKLGTFIVMQKNKQSGTIINLASTNWLSSGFNGKSQTKVQIITSNAIHYLLENKGVFSDD
jgi:hypothetical protein